jgi:alkanesulfonate monooxygenase SsuD/methylene tetrahydromethanopterin reductase-like flavin-dependent oxidoreductase (luciferase family)
VSWHRAEYEALGIPFDTRGERLDEHLAAWQTVWRPGPGTFRGQHYRFDEVYVEPKPVRPDGPRLWFGGRRLHDAMLRRLVRYGHGFNPLGRPSEDDLDRLREAMAAAGRDPDELELVGGTRGRFADAESVAPLDEALASIPEQVARGFTTICIKPSQFTDDLNEIPALLSRIVERAASLETPSDT